MCLDALFGKLQAPKIEVQNPSVPAPTPPPAPSAEVPQPDSKRSSEQDKIGADRTGFGTLIIPRSAFKPVTRGVPSG